MGIGPERARSPGSTMPETLFSNLAVYRARPTIRVNGREDERINELVEGFQLREGEGGLSSLELRFSNVASLPEGRAGLAFEDESVLRLGARLAVYAGDEHEPQEIFRGLITGVEAEFPPSNPPELMVLAEDLLQQARMARRTQIHENVTLAGLAGTVARSVGLTPRVTGFTENIGTQAQLNESDLAFLRRLLSRYDGDVQVVGDELQVSPRGEVRRGAVELELHSQLRSVRVLADLAHQVTEVTVTGWNPSMGERVTGRSSGAQGGPGSGRTGADLLREATGARSHHISHLAAVTDAEARALAETAFDARARRFVTLSGTAEGNPAIRVGTHLRLTGMSSRFDNTYYVVKACHRFDLDRGYETDFEAETGFLGYPA
jgi:Bacteriophage probable baseplate hub protein